MKPSLKSLTFWVPLILICALGFGLVWYCTVWGSGLISDSFQYIASARNLALGKMLGYQNENGITIPLTQYPPLFPVTLAAFEMMHVDSLDAARILNATLFAANIWLVGISIHKISRSTGFSLLGALLTALSQVLLETHAWVLSEPLFIFLSLLAFYWLGIYFETGRQRWLLISALAGSLVLLTRYVGLALLPVALIVIVWKTGVPRRRKWIDIGLYSLIVLLPMILWSAKNFLQSGQLNNRSLQWVPLTSKNINSLVTTGITWFVPERLVMGRERWAVWAIIILFIVFGFTLYFGNRKSSLHIKVFTPLKQPLVLLHVIYIPCYVGMVIASKMFFDSNIGMTDRMFSPLLVSLIIPGSALCASLWKNSKKNVRLFIFAASIYLLIYFTVTATPMVRKFHQQGIGLARKTWQTSEVIQSLPEYSSMPIFSNSPSTLYFWTGKTGGGIPALDQVINSGSTEKTVMVIFYHIPTNKRIDRLEQQLTLVESDSMAKIYIYEP